VKRGIVAALSLAVLAAGGARGQIGQGPDECARRWGAPISGQVNTNGYGTLRFAAGDMTIELEFVSGKALRAAYRGATLDEKAVQSILTDNGEGAEWHLFERPGQTAEENGNREWTRSEDAFMAKLETDPL